MQNDTDRAYMQSIIDGTMPDMLTADLETPLVAIYERYQDNPDMLVLFERAVNAYSDAMLALPIPGLPIPE